jgi:hypothetical protein
MARSCGARSRLTGAQPARIDYSVDAATNAASTWAEVISKIGANSLNSGSERWNGPSGFSHAVIATALAPGPVWSGSPSGYPCWPNTG